MIAGDAIFQAASAAGIRRDVATDGRDLAARRIGGIVEPHGLGLAREPRIEHTGLDDGRTRHGIDRGDAIEPRHRQNDAAIDGIRTTRETGTRAARDDRNATLVGEAQRALHFFDRARADHGEWRSRGCERRLIARVGLENVGIGHDRSTERRFERRNERGIHGAACPA